MRVSKFLVLFLLGICSSHAANIQTLSDEYLSGAWICSGGSEYQDGIVIAAKGLVVIERELQRYEYSGKLISYYSSDPTTYSQIELVLSGNYGIDKELMNTQSDKVVVTSLKDGLNWHTKEFLEGFTQDLKKRVVAKISIISMDQYASTVLETGERSECKRFKGITSR